MDTEWIRGAEPITNNSSSRIFSLTDIINPREARPNILLRPERNRLPGVPFRGQRAYLSLVSGLAAGCKVEPAARLGETIEGPPVASSGRGAVMALTTTKTAAVTQVLVLPTTSGYNQADRDNTKNPLRRADQHCMMSLSITTVASVSPRDALEKRRISCYRTQSPEREGIKLAARSRKNRLHEPVAKFVGGEKTSDLEQVPKASCRRRQCQA